MRLPILLFALILLSACASAPSQETEADRTVKRMIAQNALNSPYPRAPPMPPR